jgi:hypothetical protein
MDVPVRNIPHIGFVSEYMENPVPPHIHLIQLNLGFFSHTFGLWIKDDPVFDDHPTLLREPLQQLLFGSPLTPKEQTQWEVGCASLRDDQARLVWIALRLHQVKEGHHCALVLSPFSDPSTAGQQLEKLAADYKFDSCIIRAKDGTETTIGSKKDTTGRTLRLIHSFIDEQDFHSLIHLSAQGSLGGAGDTACIRGLLGHQPLFVDIRPDTRARWEETIRFLKKKEFPLLAQWFGSCFTPSIVDLLSQLTPELTREWEEFRLRAREELETSPWVTRYIRRCALAARTPHQKIESLETAFLKGEITLQKYNESIQQLSS